MTNFTFNFSTTMLLTGTPQAVSPLALLATGLVSSVVAMLSGTAVLQQSRADSLQMFASCQFSLVDKMSPMDNPTQLAFGSDLQQYHRGAVVGNLGLLIFLFVLVGAALAALSLCFRDTLEIVEYHDVPLLLQGLEKTSGLPEKSVEDVPPLVGVSLATGTRNSSGVPENAAVVDDDLLLDIGGSEHFGSVEGIDDTRQSPLKTDDGIPLIDDALPLQASCTKQSDVSIDDADSEGDHEGDVSAEPLCVFDLRTPEESEAADESAARLTPNSSANGAFFAAPSETPPTLPVSAHPVDTDTAPVKALKTVDERQETYSEALTRLCATSGFLSVIAVPALFMLDGTVQAAVSLLVHPIDDADQPLGVVALVVYATMFVVVLIVTLRFIKFKRRAKRLHTSDWFAMRHPLARGLRWLLLPTYEFPAAVRSERARHRMLKFIIADSNFAPFICCDMALSIVTAALVGVGISDRAVCLRLAIVEVVCFFLFFVAVVVLRPNLTRLGLILNVLAVGVGFVSSLCTLLSMALGLTNIGNASQILSFALLVINIANVLTTARDFAALALKSTRAIAYLRGGAKLDSDLGKREKDVVLLFLIARLVLWTLSVILTVPLRN